MNIELYLCHTSGFKARTLYRRPFILSCSNSEFFFHLNLLSKAKIELSSKELLFLTKIGLRNQCCFHLYFDSYLWSSFEYKKLVIELSKKVHKFTEAEQFVSFLNKVRNSFVKFSTKHILHNSNEKRREI